MISEGYMTQCMPTAKIRLVDRRMLVELIYKTINQKSEYTFSGSG
jgi:hypothetical protein